MINTNFHAENKAFVNYLIAQLPNVIKKQEIYLNELSITIDSVDLKNVLFFLANHSKCQFKSLVDLTAIDYPTRTNRFEVVYNLLSIKYNSRIRVKTSVADLMPVDSVSSIYKSAIWLEREVWDMFGIYFQGNPDLRRILTDYGFEGHPLRKDFPLSGYLEIRYDEDSKRIVYEKLELTQEFRYFNFNSPWENNQTK